MAGRQQQQAPFFIGLLLWPLLLLLFLLASIGMSVFVELLSQVHWDQDHLWWLLSHDDLKADTSCNTEFTTLFHCWHNATYACTNEHFQLKRFMRRVQSAHICLVDWIDRTTTAWTHPKVRKIVQSFSKFGANASHGSPKNLLRIINLIAWKRFD